MAQVPSAGCIVHYVSFGTPGGEYGKECRAAIITEVDLTVESPQTVGLCVLNPTGMFFNRTVPFHAADGPAEGKVARNLCGGLDLPGGTWHWPERV